MASTGISFFAGFQLGHRIVAAEDFRYTVRLGANYILAAPLQIEQAFILSEVIERLANAIPFYPIRMPVKIGCSIMPFAAIPVIFLCAAFKHGQYEGVAQVFNGILKIIRTFAVTYVSPYIPEVGAVYLRKIGAFLPTEFPEVLSEKQAKVVGLAAEHSAKVIVVATVVGVVALKFFTKSSFFVGITCSLGYGILNHYNYIPEEQTLFVEKYFPVVAFVGRVFGGGGFVSSIMATVSLCLLSLVIRIVFLQKLEESISYVVEAAIPEERLKLWAEAALSHIVPGASEDIKKALSSGLQYISSFKTVLARKEWREIFSPKAVAPDFDEALNIFNESPTLYQPNLAVWAKASTETVLAQLPKNYAFDDFLQLFKQVPWDQRYSLLRAKLMGDERFVDQIVKSRFPNYSRKIHPFEQFQKKLEAPLKTATPQQTERIKEVTQKWARYKHATREPITKKQLIDSLIELKGFVVESYNQTAAWRQMTRAELIMCVAELGGLKESIGALLTEHVMEGAGEDLTAACKKLALPLLIKASIQSTDELLETLMKAKNISVEDCQTIDSWQGLSIEELQQHIAESKNLSVEECHAQGFLGGLTKQELAHLIAASKKLPVDQYLSLGTCEELTVDEVIEALIEKDGVKATKEKYLATWAEAQMANFVRKLKNQDTETEQNKRPLVELRPMFAAILSYVHDLNDQVEKEDMLLSLAIEGGAFCTVAYEDLAKDRLDPVVQKYRADKDPLERDEENMLDLFEKERKRFFDVIYSGLQKDTTLFGGIIKNDRHAVGWIKRSLFGFLPLFKYEVEKFTLEQFFLWKCCALLRAPLYHLYNADCAIMFDKFFDEAKVGVQGTEYVYKKLQIAGNPEKIAAFQNAMSDAPEDIDSAKAFMRLYFVLLGILKKKESES